MTNLASDASDLRASDVLTFQDMILSLQRYWANLGCVIMQPYDNEVGAGTFHTATTLRSLGPDTWKTAYVQPCRRPADGRYGENPNRMQHYYQFQVLLKPSPDNVQDLYLNSLRTIGIDPEKHDIRFVEDDWESPTLGAWGLGWEVWLNGMEVTQFTYFQQVGGFECRPVPSEITYGLERLAMYIQGVDSVYDLIWARGDDGSVFTYGDVFLENEREFLPITLRLLIPICFSASLIATRLSANEFLKQVFRFLHTITFLSVRTPLTCSMHVVSSAQLNVWRISYVFVLLQKLVVLRIWSMLLVLNPLKMKKENRNVTAESCF